MMTNEKRIKHYFSNQKNITFIFLSLLFCACNSSPEEISYSGKLIELNYHNVEGIQNEHWVEIEGVKFTHYEDLNLARQNVYSLPASIFLMKHEESGEEFRSPGGDVSIAIQFGNYINKISKGDEEDFEFRFKSDVAVANQVLLLTQGRLQIKSNDGSDLTVNVPHDYPVPISVLE